MSLILSVHAAEMMEERRIALTWVEAVLARPETAEPDPLDPSLTRSYRAIPEAQGKVLRVVHRPEGANVLIVTAYFDRGRRR